MNSKHSPDFDPKAPLRLRFRDTNANPGKQNVNQSSNKEPANNSSRVTSETNSFSIAGTAAWFVIGISVGACGWIQRDSISEFLNLPTHQNRIASDSARQDAADVAPKLPATLPLGPNLVTESHQAGELVAGSNLDPQSQLQQPDSGSASENPLLDRMLADQLVSQSYEAPKESSPVAPKVRTASFSQVITARASLPDISRRGRLNTNESSELTAAIRDCSSNSFVRLNENHVVSDIAPNAGLTPKGNQIQRSRSELELMEMLASVQAQVRQAASQELVRRGWNTDQVKLARKLAAGNAEARIASLDQLTSDPKLNAKPWLLWMAYVGERSVRLAAIEELQMLLSKEDIATLKLLSQAETDPGLEEKISALAEELQVKAQVSLRTD